ncbi:ABC transporter substrate-binding protein [Salinigranum salinum]|uniref:ABC transporter substrate-binding protein n=1 Tax=Salinigranum salinum TaxID=1364937 RepID=UPI001260C098|nr:extracellular solute-binding protein [Salinigranum salinum]
MDSDPCKRESQSRVSRRRFAQAVGGSALVGLAGCQGQSSSSTGTTDDSGGDGSGGSGGQDSDDGGGSTATDSGEWPDLSGQEVHVLTEESSTQWQTFWNELNTAFEQATGASVNIEYVGLGTGYRERLTQLLQAGDPPEVTHIGVQDIVTFATNGQAGDVTPAVEYIEEEYGTEINTERGAVLLDGTHHMVPLFINADMYHYRDDIATDVGDDFPQNWDDVLAMAEEYDQGRGGMRADYFPLGQNDCAKYYILSQAYMAGGTVCSRDDSGELQITMHEGSNREAWIQALDYWKARAQFSAIDTQGDCGAYSSAIPSETTFAGHYFGNRPKIQSVGQDLPFAASVRERQCPRPEGKADNPVLGLLQGVSTFQNANVEAANEWIKFLVQPDFLFDFLMLSPVHNAPIAPEIVQHEEYQSRLADLPDAWTDQDIQAHLTEENRRAFPHETDPPNPYTGQLFADDALWQLAWDVLQEDMDSGQALDKAATTLQETLESAK